MKAPYSVDEMERAKIDMLTPDGWVVGEIVTAGNADPNEFGMRADWLVAIQPDGTHLVRVHNFNAAQIRGIKKTADPALPFTADVR